MPNERSAGIVVFRVSGSGSDPQRRAHVGREYLILHYEEGHWDFPKGHIESGEDAKAAAIRECQEETGITKLDFVHGFEDKIDYWYTRDKQKWHKDVVFFLAKTTESEVKISHEHVGFVWLGYEEAVAKVTFENAKSLLARAESYLKKQEI